MFSPQQISKSVFVLRGNRLHLCIINDSERHPNSLSDLDSETFHEIIYGKPDAAQKCAAFFFLPCRVNLLKFFYLCRSSLIQGFLEAWYLLIRRRNRGGYGEQKFRLSFPLFLQPLILSRLFWTSSRIQLLVSADAGV